jgi:hypothetical protein
LSGQIEQSHSFTSKASRMCAELYLSSVINSSRRCVSPLWSDLSSSVPRSTGCFGRARGVEAGTQAGRQAGQAGQEIGDLSGATRLSCLADGHCAAAGVLTLALKWKQQSRPRAPSSFTALASKKDIGSVSASCCCCC